MMRGGKGLFAIALTIILTAGVRPVEAQLVGVKLTKVPRWDAAVHVALGLGGDPLFLGGWALSGAGRVTDWLAIAGEAGKQGQGNLYCKGETCLPGPPKGFCPCEHAKTHLFSGTVVVAGPRFQITGRMFTRVLVGGVSTDVLPTQFIIRPGVGWDFGGEAVKFRLETNIDVVPGQSGMSRPWLLLGLVVRVGSR